MANWGDETLGQLQPRFEEGRTITIAGLKERYAYEDACKGIPTLWTEFGPVIENLAAD